MRWRTGRRSQNIEDRRGRRVSRGIAGGGIGMVVMALIAMFMGVDPGMLLQGLPGGGTTTTTQVPATSGAAPKDALSDFISVVLADTEDVWREVFQGVDRRYQEPRLVLFSGAVESACGFAQAAVGPFYCPEDHKVYIDLDFLRELKSRFQAPGDFAQAYVIAHEVGHHVQNLLGISKQVHSLQQSVGKQKANELSVRLELQADCLAGVWANHAHRTRQILESGDIEEALSAASGVGDDRLQKQTRGYVSPESFTHGSSAQRVRWFTRGIKTGDLAECEAFETAGL